MEAFLSDLRAHRFVILTYSRSPTYRASSDVISLLPKRTSGRKPKVYEAFERMLNTYPFVIIGNFWQTEPDTVAVFPVADILKLLHKDEPPLIEEDLSENPV